MTTQIPGSLAPSFVFLNDHRFDGPFSMQGKWFHRESGPTIAIGSPTDGSTIANVAAFTREEVDATYEFARQSQRSWMRQSVDQRAVYLHRYADALEAHSEWIVDGLMQEIAKNRRDSREEVSRSADLIRFTAEDGRRLSGELYFGDAFPKGRRGKLGLSQRVPLGVILGIPPFNYPINLSVSKLAPALITGNVLVLKPPTQGSFVALALQAVAEVAGLPPGVVNVVTGRGSEIGDYLASHAAVNMLTFTGSTETGTRLAKLVGMIPIQMELGGKDAAIVLADADVDRAASEIVAGAYAYSGQRCTAVKRVLVTPPVADELVSKIQQGVLTLSTGTPQDDAVVTPLIDTAAANFVEALIHDAIERGADVYPAFRRDGNLIHPVVVDHVTTEMKLAWEEPFGPVLPIIRVESAAEALNVANQSEYGLQGSVFTQNLDLALQIADLMEVGTVQVNGRTARGPDHFPFLGVKGSGTGAQGVRHSIESMTRVKSVVFNTREAADLTGQV